MSDDNEQGIEPGCIAIVGMAGRFPAARTPAELWKLLAGGREATQWLTDEELRAAPYKVLQDWQRYYGGNLLIVLPDAFGTTAFLRDAPDWVAGWTGFRPDSAPPIGAMIATTSGHGVMKNPVSTWERCSTSSK